MFEYPVVTVTPVQKLFRVTHPTARSDLKRLHGIGIIKPLDGQPQITYFRRRISEVTYEDLDPGRVPASGR